jgi:hypothetical protein
LVLKTTQGLKLMRDSIHVMSSVLLIVVAVVPSAGAGEHAVPTAAEEPPFFLIRPGTPIADGPPRSWTHLVVKAQSKLASGDLDTLPGWGARMAARIRTVILADVGHAREETDRFRLRRVGIGLCMSDRTGRDIVVNSACAADVGFDLGALEQVVLESAEAELARGRMIVSTPTFGIYRSPTTMLMDGEHRAVELFYGFLVDPKSGALKVVVWSRAARASAKPEVSRLVVLRPNLVYDCPIDVKASRLLGTIPISWSFAMRDVPPGRTRMVSEDLAELLEAVATDHPDPAILEKALIDLLAARSTVRERKSTAAPPTLGATSGPGPARSGRTSTSESARRGTSRAVR